MCLQRHLQAGWELWAALIEYLLCSLLIRQVLVEHLLCAELY